MRYQVSNCDLKGDRAYFFSHDIFPLAFLEVQVEKSGLQYNLLDSVASTDYAIPPFRVMKLELEIAIHSVGKLYHYSSHRQFNLWGN